MGQNNKMIYLLQAKLIESSQNVNNINLTRKRDVDKHNFVTDLS